jgi:hypothetical protein
MTSAHGRKPGLPHGPGQKRGDIGRRAVAIVLHRLLQLHVVRGALQAAFWGLQPQIVEVIQRANGRLARLFGVNLWRILRFFEPYRDDPELLPPMGALPWTHNLSFWGSPVPAALTGRPWVISKIEDWSHLDISSTCRKNRIRGACSSIGCSD